jgi:arginyl-tRNA synthetase
MHVGHLRTTIIGDCFNRVLSAVGDTVIPQNHIGDWGRQFGMLIEQILFEDLDLDTLDLPGAEDLYLRANAHLSADESFAEKARERVVMLQSGDEATREIWSKLIAVSKRGFNKTYARLNVLLTDDDIAGESSYNDKLGEICADLEARGIAVKDQGALVVFVDGFDAPAIMRNSAGGYGYDVTDVAALRHRVEDLHADRLIYVTDARQANHFALLFGVCRKAGYLPESVTAEHIGYGMVLGKDGHPFKTRDGGAVHLDDLLDEAEKHAAPAVALAAIKYADLSNGIQKDYVFDPERMTATTGDTGPYLQYAHARVTQILARATAEGLEPGQITQLAEPQEQTLALALTGFGDVVAEVAKQLTPHKLCGYLYDLSVKFSAFYENCPVMKSEGEVRASRLALCQATRQILGAGLNLLGIAAPDRM